MGGVETGGRRRRRTPEVAEAEIVAAAEALLRERSFRELTVDEVMRRTDLSRPSFYVYFRDRHHLMLRGGRAHRRRAADDVAALVHRRRRRAGAGARGDGGLRRGLRRSTGRCCGRSPTRPTDDPEVERVYGGLVQSFVDVTARHIEAEIEAGRVLPLDAAGDRAGARVDDGALPEPLARAVEPTRRARSSPTTLTTIWTRVLYGVG